MIFPRWLCDKRRCWCSSKNGGGMETHNRVCITERAMRIWFWIYYHCETGEITCGDLIEGDVITGGPGTHGSISFVNSDMTNETCAFFHTHTPVRYCGYGASRITGDSEADRKGADGLGIPGLVYDYTAPIIKSENDINSAAHVRTFGTFTSRLPIIVNSH